MKSWILSTILLLLSIASIAHTDTPIKLSEKGKLIGLPEKYSVAKFDRSTFTLTINHKQITVPECVKEFFKDYKYYKIEFSASWYHDPELMPHYIHMDIVTAENPIGCQIFFNLETLEIFQIAKPVMKPKRNKPIQYLFNEQEISAECRKLIQDSIIDK